jgi:mono/diheme cytochrome c family protein
MTLMLRVLCAAALAGASACASTSGGGVGDGDGEVAAPAEVAAPTTPTATAPASFSDEQADRGRSVFRATCTECHYSSEFRDRQFRFKWRRRTVADLFEHISTSMPENSPGSLPDQQYVDVITYILRMNGFEPGMEELPADPDAMETISLARFYKS